MILTETDYGTYDQRLYLNYGLFVSGQEARGMMSKWSYFLNQPLVLCIYYVYIFSFDELLQLIYLIAFLNLFD